MKAGAALAGLALALQAGCLLWPFPTGQLLSGRGRIRTTELARLEVGRSTRDDVICLLGEPDGLESGGQVLVYRWTEVRGFLLVGDYGGAAAIPFPGHRAYRFEFGAGGRLARVAGPRPESDAGRP